MLCLWGILFLTFFFGADVCAISTFRLSASEGLTSNVVGDFAQDGEGYMWIRCDYGLNRYDGYSVRQYQTEEVFGGESVRQMRLSADSSRLEFVMKSGTVMALFLEADTFGVVGQESAPTTDETTFYDSVTVRYERRGRGQAARIWTDDEGRHEKLMQLLPEKLITRSLRDHFHAGKLKDGREIISTYGNGFFIYDPETDALEHHLSTDREKLIGTDYITKLYVDRSGCVWMAEDWIGAVCLRFDTQKHRRFALPHAENPEGNNVRAICATGGDTVLAADNLGNVYRLSLTTGETTHVAHYDHRVYAIGADRDGRIWTGTRGGGLYADGTRVSGTEGMNIYQVRFANDGTTWAAAMDGGLIQISAGVNGEWGISRREPLGDVRRIQMNTDGTVTPETLERGIMTAETDQYGNRWTATQSGLTCTFCSGAAEEMTFPAATPLGNVYNENASAQTADGTLLFGTHEGLIMISPQQKRKAHALRPTITNIRDTAIVLPHDKAALTIEFSTLDFATLASARYEYRIVGLDTTWYEAEEGHRVSFGSLPAGEYTFCVRTDESDEEARLHITVQEAWWGTGGAMAVYCLTALCIAAAVALSVRKKREAREDDVRALPDGAEEPSEPAAPADPWREKLLETIDEHIGDMNLSVESLGTMMGLGRTQFNKRVKETMGVTPIQLIKQKRLDHAAKLLRETDYNIEEVMRQCGLRSANIFYSDFKKRFGCTPASLRNG